MGILRTQASPGRIGRSVLKLPCFHAARDRVIAAIGWGGSGWLTALLDAFHHRFIVTAPLVRYA